MEDLLIVYYVMVGLLYIFGIIPISGTVPDSSIGKGYWQCFKIGLKYHVFGLSVLAIVATIFWTVGAIAMS